MLFCQSSGYGPNVTLSADIPRNVLFVALLTTPEELLWFCWQCHMGQTEKPSLGYFAALITPITEGWWVDGAGCFVKLSWHFHLFFFFFYWNGKLGRWALTAWGHVLNGFLINKQPSMCGRCLTATKMHSRAFRKQKMYDFLSFKKKKGI